MARKRRRLVFFAVSNVTGHRNGAYLSRSIFASEFTRCENDVFHSAQHFVDSRTVFPFTFYITFGKRCFTLFRVNFVVKARTQEICLQRFLRLFHLAPSQHPLKISTHASEFRSSSKAWFVGDNIRICSREPLCSIHCKPPEIGRRESVQSFKASPIAPVSRLKCLPPLFGGQVVENRFCSPAFAVVMPHCNGHGSAPPRALAGQLALDGLGRVPKIDFGLKISLPVIANFAPKS